MELSDEQIQEMVGTYLERGKEQLRKPIPEWEYRLKDTNEVNPYLGVLEQTKDYYRDLIAIGDHTEVEERALSLLADFGVNSEDIANDSTAYHMLCEELLIADINLFEYEQGRLSGKSVAEIESANTRNVSSVALNRDTGERLWGRCRPIPKPAH